MDEKGTGHREEATRVMQRTEDSVVLARHVKDRLGVVRRRRRAAGTEGDCIKRAGAAKRSV